jgi:hypothetical protein
MMPILAVVQQTNYGNKNGKLIKLGKNNSQAIEKKTIFKS